MILDSCILVYKVINDIIMYVVGNTAENELILQSVLQALDETVSNLLKSVSRHRIATARRRQRGAELASHGDTEGIALISPLPVSVRVLIRRNQVSKKTLVENLDLLLLSIDEIIDDGLILETDSNLVVGRVCMVGGGGADNKDVPLSEQTFTQALQTARDQLVKSFR
jgi:hypothetical protein